MCAKVDGPHHLCIWSFYVELIKETWASDEDELDIRYSHLSNERTDCMTDRARKWALGAARAKKCVKS